MSREKIGVVIHRRLLDSIMSRPDRARLENLAEAVWTDSVEPITVAQACELLADCTIGLGSWRTPHPCPEIMAAAPKLRFWEHAAGSVRKMFGPHLKGRDFTIASCKTAIADCVAEMTLAEIILGLRRVFENAQANRVCTGGRTPKPARMKVTYGSTIGVVGAGEVGKRLIGLLKAFPCRVLLYDPLVSEAQAALMGVTLVRDLTELCCQCDVVTLHTPAIPSTAKMMGAAQFKAMKDDAVFINTARSMCVDEQALVAELQAGRLSAFLDVPGPELTAAGSQLRKLPNLVLTSHIAGPQSLNIGAQAVDDIATFIGGGKPLAVVTEDMLDYTA